MVERCHVVVVRNREGVLHTPMVVKHRIHWWVTLHQDETGASRIEEHHLLVRRGGQMLAADDVGIELRAFRTSLPGMLKWATALIATICPSLCHNDPNTQIE